MGHSTHEDHDHTHGSGCGHTQIKHGDHTDFVHEGHLHSMHNSHVDECSIAVGMQNPSDCKETACECGHGNCEHETIPHGDHTDRLVDGRLHFHHGGHCDDHGPISVM